MVVDPHSDVGDPVGRNRALLAQNSAESLMEQTHVKHDFRSPEGFQPWVSIVATGNQETKFFCVNNPKIRMGKQNTKGTDQSATKMKHKKEEFLLFLNIPMIHPYLFR
jgi:hypothetical protein